MATSAQSIQTRVTNYSLYKQTSQQPARSRSLITPSAAWEIRKGDIPDLRAVCMQLYRMYSRAGASQSALESIPVLQDVICPGPAMLERFRRNPKTSHVLVQNNLLKIVLIHWPPGKISSIHGHPKGGCMFKVLQGSLEELRYTPTPNPKLLSTSTVHSDGMAYIDDNMAYHAVGNPFNNSAYSLHIYTFGHSMPLSVAS